MNYTNEQKVEMFDQLHSQARKGDQREIIRSLEQIGWNIPIEMRTEIEDYDRHMQGLPPLHQPQQPDPQQQYYQEQQAREAMLRQTQGANYNSPQVIEANKLVQDKLKELDAMKADLLKAKETMTKDVKTVENTILADRYNQRLISEIAEYKKEMPGLEHLDDEALLDTVKQANASYFREHKDVLDTGDILAEIHNQQAKTINQYITDESKKLPLFEDDDDDDVVVDTEDNVIGKLNEEGKLVKTLTKQDTVADNVKSEPVKKEPVVDLTGDTHQKVLKDGTIRIDSEVDPNQVVNALDQARDDTQSKIQAVIEADFKAQEGGDDGAAAAAANDG